MIYEMATRIRRRPVQSLGDAVREALLTTFQFTLLLLLILGIGGVAFQAVSPSGWLLDVLASAWGMGPMYLFFTSMGILAGATWAHKAMHRRPAVASRTGDLFAAGFIGMGIFFLVQFYFTGSI